MRIKVILLFLLFLFPAATARAQTPGILSKAVVFIRVEYLKGGETWEARGTGFFVYVEDKRLGEHRGYAYLVTNRHVASPGAEEGNSYRVLRVFLRFNLRHPVH